MANRSQFGTPPATGGSGGIGNVVGPSSAVNNNLAAFDTTTGKLLKDSGIATSQVATSQTAATAVARLALTGLARGARVYQTDNGFWYELTNAAAPSDAASWQGIPKKYVALLTQTGTDAPVATVLENTLGGTVIWTRSDAGLYLGTLTGAFLATKVFPFVPSVVNAVPGDAAPGGAAYLNLWRNNDNSVLLQTSDGGDFLDLSALITAPYVQVSILVYP